jgi:streptogramin lyase
LHLRVDERDRSIFVADARSGAIDRLAPGAQNLEVWIVSGDHNRSVTLKSTRSSCLRRSGRKVAGSGDASPPGPVIPPGPEK